MKKVAYRCFRETLSGGNISRALSKKKKEVERLDTDVVLTYREIKLAGPGGRVV
jgi:hypothetical protein